MSFSYCCLGCYQIRNLKLQFFLYGKFSCRILYQEHYGFPTIYIEFFFFPNLYALLKSIPKKQANCYNILSTFLDSLNTIATLYTIPCGLGSAVRFDQSNLYIHIYKDIYICILLVFILVKIASLIMFSPFFLFSTRVSNELGARNPQAARVAVFAVLFLAIIEMGIVSTILLATRRVFCYTFSNEKEVVDYVTTMTPLVCLSVILDSIQGVFSGRKFLFSVLSIVY